MVRITDEQKEKYDAAVDALRKILGHYKEYLKGIEEFKIAEGGPALTSGEVESRVNNALYRLKEFSGKMGEWKISDMSPNDLSRLLSDNLGTGNLNSNSVMGVINNANSFRKMNDTSEKLDSLVEGYISISNNETRNSNSTGVSLTESIKRLGDIKEYVNSNNRIITVDSLDRAVNKAHTHYEQAAKEIAAKISKIDVDDVHFFTYMDQALAYDKTVNSVIDLNRKDRTANPTIKASVAKKVKDYLMQEVTPELNMLEHISEKKEIGEDEKFYATQAITTIGQKCKRFGAYLNAENVKQEMLNKYEKIVNICYEQKK